MTAPWASANISNRANRWLDQQDVALLGFSRGSSTAGTIDGHRDRGLFTTSGGRTDVRAQLSVHQLIPPNSGRAEGVSTASASFGVRSDLLVRIDGHAATQGELMLGSNLGLAGISAGSSVTTDAYLDIQPDPRGRPHEDKEDDEVRRAERQRRAFMRSSGRVMT